MIRINKAADLEDMWGGQNDFEVSVILTGDDGLWDIVGAGHTVAEAVADARKTFKGWRHANDCPVCGAPDCVSCVDPEERDGDGLDEHAP
jgi:hypothetical protein